ncbi:formylglycine-generating enzyme family protein [Ferrigenium sp. UT5]|uniref:formylglycine-generating enzyme family protein n=1 Tax=Ferrigenium sp. UT5 TaxID=3242105 RepID=UPI00354BCFA1
MLRPFGTTLIWLCLVAALPAAWAGQPPLPDTIEIPAGSYVSGSDRAERDYAYALDEAAYGSPITRTQQWYESEPPRGVAETGAYAIMTTPVTIMQYAAFVRDTGHRVPDVDRRTWESYGLRHDYAETRRFAWSKGKPPQGREDHPVVLVSAADAKAYARWLSKLTGHTWRLPTGEEWEKAARGTDGRYFPWGNKYDPARLNSADRGSFDTTPSGSYAAGASPFGILDAAGQVFEWTATTNANGSIVVKGGSWDDKGCGVCRPAARHSRPPGLKHILIGFRLVRE